MEKNFQVINGNFFGMFDFSHTEDEANDHLLIFEQSVLTKDLTLDNGTILPKGTKFDAIWWYLKDCRFQFINWVPHTPHDFMPDEERHCTQAKLMDQGWWAEYPTQNI